MAVFTKVCPKEHRTEVWIVVRHSSHCCRSEVWNIEQYRDEVRELQYPAVVTVVGVKYEISDSVTVALRAPGEDLGSLCWGIRLSQSKPFHIIGQGHLLSSRSEEAFPTNATQLARFSILCFTPFPNLFYPCIFFLILSPLLSPSSKTLNSTFPFSHLLHFIFLHFFWFFQSCVFSVIGYALLRCAIVLHTLRWRNRPGHTKHLCRILMNVCVCVCVRAGKPHPIFYVHHNSEVFIQEPSPLAKLLMLSYHVVATEEVHVWTWTLQLPWNTFWGG